MLVMLIGIGPFAVAQTADTTGMKQLGEIKIVGFKSMNGIGHFNEVHRSVIYAGKKTEVIEVDSIDANKAINNTRQILGRVPGLNIVESETGGFVANGIGVRGLNPSQSLEMNVRQNGYNVAADVYGYNETYYLPPMEAVARVEIVKGASSIQFGSQIGGMINYILKEGSDNTPFSYSTMQTIGSDGLFNSYHAAGGTVKKLNYFAFLNYRTLNGWRPNSAQQQLTGYGKMSYQLNDKITFALEYSLLRNKIKMPGGLTDDQFEADTKSSVRSRNWLKSPWNVVTASMDYAIMKNTSLQVKTTFLKGERSLVWFNKLPGEPDNVDALTGEYADREIDREMMKNIANEVRILHTYQLGKMKSTLATGLRFAVSVFDRKEEAPGTNKSDFNLIPTADFEEKYHFTTTNLAVFAENTLQVSDRFSVTPGIRFESLASEAESEIEVDGIEKETEQEKERGFLLMGAGLQCKASKSMSLYGNITEAYRPVDYAQLVPLGTVSQVDPNMKDPKGWNTDIGIRGQVQNYFNYDISLFYLAYNNRIGVVQKADANGQLYTLRTNIDESIHKGIESYTELNITRAAKADRSLGNLSIYNSFSYTRARYTKGIYKGNQVEYAPEIINRVGITYTKKIFTTSFQLSNQSKAYGDAANTERSINPAVGRIPGYSVMDWSLSFGYKKLKLKAGINNLADKRYFTQRTDEYPGPGIIPSTGRSYYMGIGYNL